MNDDKKKELSCKFDNIDRRLFVFERNRNKMKSFLSVLYLEGKLFVRDK